MPAILTLEKISKRFGAVVVADSIDLTLQFISYDLELSGNSNFHFRYNAQTFARPLDYGLIQ